MPEERIKVIVRRTPTYIAKFVSLSVKPTSFAYEQEFTVNYTIRNEGTGILDAFDVGAATIDDRPLRKVGDGSTQYIKLNPGETKSGSFVRKLMHDYPTTDLSLGSHSLEVLLFVTPEGADEPIDVPTDERKLPISLIAPPEVTCDKPTPHYGSGCKLLLHYDDDNDGILDVTDSVKAKIDGMAESEVDFIKKGIMKGSINAVCPNCYTAPPKPVTITPSELRWTNGTYRATFRIGNLVPTTKYSVVILAEYAKIMEEFKGVSSYDITTNIPKADLDREGYRITCEIYNHDNLKVEASESYVVPPYTIKGNVDISRSTIPTTIYLEESAVFDMMVENTGDREKEYAVILTFKNVDSGEKFEFTPEYTVRVPAGGAGLNKVSVVMPSEAIPIGKEAQTFDLIYKLEIW